jgi:hypothetical protein
MRKEDDFSKGKRGPVIPPDPNKTRITIRLDTKILKWFWQRVDDAGGGNYQTMINEALKRYIEKEDKQAFRYPGSPNWEFEEKLRTIMEADGYELSASGYNREADIRDLSFTRRKAA